MYMCCPAWVSPLRRVTCPKFKYFQRGASLTSKAESSSSSLKPAQHRLTFYEIFSELTESTGKTLVMVSPLQMQCWSSTSSAKDTMLLSFCAQLSGARGHEGEGASPSSVMYTAEMMLPKKAYSILTVCILVPWSSATRSYDQSSLLFTQVPSTFHSLIEMTMVLSPFSFYFVISR